MTAIAIPLGTFRPHAPGAPGLRAALLAFLAARAAVPRTLPPPHDPVELEPEDYLTCATRRRAASTFD